MRSVGTRNLGATRDVEEVRTRVAELHAVCARPEMDTEILDSLPTGEPEDAIYVPLAYRVRGFAMAQQGDPAAAERWFAKSLAVARERDSRFDAFEGLLGLARLARVRGADTEEDLFGELTAMLDQMGVMAVVVIPITVT